MLPDEEQPAEGHNLGQKIVIVLTDVFILLELTGSIIWGKQDPENMVAAFLFAFIPMVAATLIITKILLRNLRSK